MNEFKPGDRIINVFNQTGTVKVRPPERTGPGFNMRHVYYDADGHDYPFNNTDPSLLKRQPIEPGCWVREVPGSNVFGKQDPVEVFEVDGTKARVKGFLGTFWTDAAKLIRVADPEPDLASGPDQTVFVMGVYDPRHLKQAQDLANALHTKHFAETAPDWKVADDLTTVLDQIDNMTAGMIRKENHDHEKLGEFIMHNVDGEPCQPDEGAVDCAIRVMQEQADSLRIRNTAIREAAKLLRRINLPGPETKAWLDQYDPQPTFKRGDLVTWGTGYNNARIIAVPAAISYDEQIEVMFVTGNVAGQTRPVLKSELRHVKPE